MTAEGASLRRRRHRTRPSEGRRARVANACSPEALLAGPNAELVVNLTHANVHAEVSMAAIRADTHVYSEKPLAAT